MNQAAYLRRIRGAIEGFDHPYLQAAVTGDGIDTGMFAERFGEFLDAAAQRGIISGRERTVLDRHYGVSGEAKTLAEIGNDDDITDERARVIEERACQKLTGDRRSRKILDGLSDGSYEWPVDVLQWDVLDLAPSLHGDPNLFRFLSKLEAGSVSELTELTAQDLSRKSRYSQKILAGIRQKLSEHELHLRGEEITPAPDNQDG